LLLAATWATASGLIFGTILHGSGFYELLDRFGLVPFALFTLAPIFFGTARQRNMLLKTVVVLGLYLGATGVLEGVHAYSLLFPHYIANPNVGLHWGRARGPFLESDGDGFCLFAGAAASVVALTIWRSRWARRLCYATIGLDGVAIFFTLTRGVWIGAFLGAAAALVLTRRGRRFLPVLIVGGALAVVVTLAVAPNIRAEVEGRATSQLPVWARENTDLAALRIVAERPLTGVGWANFANVSSQYMRQQPGYPLDGFGLEVHNVFLSHAAELGIPGFLLWLIAFAGAVWRGLSKRPAVGLDQDLPSRSEADPQGWREPWRLCGVALVTCFVVVANTTPFTEPLPNALLWLWLGVLATPYTSRLHRLGPTCELAPTLQSHELQPTYS
jgi:O-antigen ligase